MPSQDLIVFHKGKHRKVYESGKGQFVKVKAGVNAMGKPLYKRKYLKVEKHLTYKGSDCIRALPNRCSRVSGPSARKLIAKKPGKAVLESLLAQCKMSPKGRCVLKQKAAPKKKPASGRPRGRPRKQLPKNEHVLYARGMGNFQ